MYFFDYAQNEQQKECGVNAHLKELCEEKQYLPH